MIKLIFMNLLVLLGCNTLIFGQTHVQGIDTSLTLQAAIKWADNNYPEIQAGTYVIKSAEYNVKLQQDERLPKLDINLQSNSSTLNNTYGLMFPQNAVLPISGPVKEGNTYQAVWGSAAGIMVSWQPYTFGERNAKIGLSKSEFNEANNVLVNEKFSHNILIINNWLDFLASKAIIKARQVNIKRILSMVSLVRSLTNSGLRPGVDSFIIQGELSKANIDLNKAIREAAVYKLKLSELLGRTNTSYTISSQNLLSKIPVVFPLIDNVSEHPLLKLYQSKIEVAHNELSLTEHQYHPEVNVLASSFARGSGADISGNNDYSLNGLRFSKYNYAFGLSVAFPVMKFFPNKAERRIREYNLSSVKLLLTDQKLKLHQAEATAAVYIKTSIKNYQESNNQLAAAEESFKEMEARYKNGLTNLPELFQVQYALSKAEEEHAIALLAIWKSYLYYTKATGNINVFLNQVK